MSDGRTAAKERKRPYEGMTIGQVIQKLSSQDTKVVIEREYDSSEAYVNRPEMGGIKYDQDKVEYHHMPAEALEEVNKALTYGSKKYSDYQWRGGFVWSRPFNACMRHLWAYWRGEDIDKESGCYHLACAAANILFLLQFLICKIGTDNRYKQPEIR